MLPALTAGHLVMNHATGSKKATLEAAKLIEGTGAAFLDAPFTGSKMAAQNGKLCYYIGASHLLLARSRPVLEASATKIMPRGAVLDEQVPQNVTQFVVIVIWEPAPKAVAVMARTGFSH